MKTIEKTANRLINEKSPYLLQHAYNPVDWYPWGDEAFTKAKQEDKPVFISIGYSTCHWCHVMEREAFEDKEAADILNKYFVSIKVDREERPDIDAVYMNAAQLMNGNGGWPLSVFADNDKRPVFTGTYFPMKDGRHGIGFITLLERIASLWQYDRAKLFDASIKIIEEMNKTSVSKDIDYERTILKGFAQLSDIYDKKYGGFGSAPKFPVPHNILFLIKYYNYKKDEAALEIAERSLQSMYRGGIYDHIGFGFCRYSTDRMWLVPHFEKMLYDNALLARAYCEAYQCTKNPFYAKAAKEIFEYIARDMTAESGGFYNAEDADSEGIEGKFYVFTKHEIIKLLGEQDGEKYCARYDITEDGNFEGENILNLINNSDIISENNVEFFEDCRKRLFKYREKRTRPFKDDKITVSWNGLMIGALAYGGRVLNNDNYIEAAKKAVSFIFNNMADEYGGLFTSYRDGEAKFNAVADDYAYFIWGLIELYESTLESAYLFEANRLNKFLTDNFWESGAICMSGKNSEKLIAQTREIYDGAMPSANSVSINNFIKLSRLYGEHKLEEMAVEIIRFFGDNLETAPHAHSFALCGLMQYIFDNKNNKDENAVYICDNNACRKIPAG